MLSPLLRKKIPLKSALSPLRLPLPLCSERHHHLLPRQPYHPPPVCCHSCQPPQSLPHAKTGRSSTGKPDYITQYPPLASYFPPKSGQILPRGTQNCTIRFLLTAPTSSLTSPPPRLAHYAPLLPLNHRVPSLERLSLSSLPNGDSQPTSPSPGSLLGPGAGSPAPFTQPSYLRSRLCLLRLRRTSSSRRRRFRRPWLPLRLRLRLPLRCLRPLRPADRERERVSRPIS